MRFYGTHKPPAQFDRLTIGGHCPHCGDGGRWSISAPPNWGEIRSNTLKEIEVGYYCELCLGPIPIRWRVENLGNAVVNDPRLELRAVPPYDFSHVPSEVRREIEEALDCLSVGAYNGFASVSRRAIQAISTNLGAKATARVKKQIKEAAELAGLDEETKKIAFEIMLSGHDGSHPHLPDVDAARAEILLALMQDLTSQLYTRPGKIAESAALRRAAIDSKAEA